MTMDIRDRLKKLAGLVRHDEEALSTCEDAIKEFDKFYTQGTIVANPPGSSGYYTLTAGQIVFSVPPPPSRTTQVKFEPDVTDHAWVLLGKSPPKPTQTDDFCDKMNDLITSKMLFDDFPDEVRAQDTMKVGDAYYQIVDAEGKKTFRKLPSWVVIV